MAAAQPTDRPATWLDVQGCQVEDLAAVVAEPTLSTACPSAMAIEQGVPIYDCNRLRVQLSARDSDVAARCRALMAEWVAVLATGPGVLALRSAFDHAAMVDATTAVFHRMIDAARAAGAKGDHFAKPGANDRVWNALEKLCEQAPELFAAYYANDMLALVCEAWLGPAYQVTSQINCVNPGGEAQAAHRDYHLGFMTPAQGEAFPAHVHRLSPVLTLQGAVAHVDMPLESGPTLYLPHSQKYLRGYLLAGQPQFQAFFDAHCVQLPLRKGDAVFFNPALLHAAGHNRSKDIRRLANLLQVSSAFGRAMETVDRTRMSLRLYPVLRQRIEAGAMSGAEALRAIAACAEGYAFPTNLDRDPPIGGLAPESQQALMIRALRESWPADRFAASALEQAGRRT